MASLKFSNVYINDNWTITGPMESDSKLKKIDIKLDDYYFDEKTFEQAEIRMQKMAINSILARHKLSSKDIDLIVGGDLLNQIAASNYANNATNIPFVGIYSACATFPESLIIAGSFLKNDNVNKIIGITSCHNLTAEKQFRYPIEYGSPRTQTSTWTSTAAISVLLSKKKKNIKVESGTIGKIIDMGIKDTNNMGAIMAPAAAQTLYEHLSDLNRNVDYYDLILTGDLGCVGGEIFKEYCSKTYNIKIKKHLDAGCELYLKSQNVYAGGSGPSCLPLVLFNKILLQKKYKRILIIGTGSLHSPVMVNQKISIPAIAHAVSLEVL